MDMALPAIALVQSEPSDADLIETSLRNAGMRNPIVRYDTVDALIDTLPEQGADEALTVAMAIVESDAWTRLALWRDNARQHLLPVIITFEHDHELQAFAQLRVLHAAGMLKPFAPRALIHMLEPLRCRWLLMEREEKPE
jgi:DNA-binding response OmpR family regulator